MEQRFQIALIMRVKFNSAQSRYENDLPLLKLVSRIFN